ncbi:MAG: hypothetical protein ACLTYN_03660 [Dysosmobacter welbionis]
MGVTAHNCGQVAAAVLTLGNTAPLLPAGAAGGVPLYRGIDGAERRLPVPGAGTYKTVGGVSGWTSGIRAKRTRSSCGSWR